MSRFFSSRHAKLVPYTPGEQPRDMQFIKLNTNESPFPPPKSVLDVLRSELPEQLNLYSDPTCLRLREALANYHGVDVENVSVANGSDETLAFAFLAYGSEQSHFVFPDITYGLYDVVSVLYGIPYSTVPLKDTLEINPDDYLNVRCNVVLSNPNAPTGIVLPLSEIERIAVSNTDNIVVVDEAYADFWGQSAISLTAKYDNLLVVRTYSKSRNMAGARIGYAIGNKALIYDLEAIRYSINPYNLNSLTLAAGAAAFDDNDYYEDCWATICATREETKTALRSMGFTVTDSQANFIFANHTGFTGPALYSKLRERGILVRNLSHPRIRDWLRITVGTGEQMRALLSAINEILEEREDEKREN